MAGQIKRMVALLFGSAVIGTLLLVLVFCLPVEGMRQHVTASVGDILMDEDSVGNSVIRQYIWENGEHYTDAIMVQNAIEKIEGKSVFEHAMWMYHSDVDPETWKPEESLKQFSSDYGGGLYFLHQYSRYWHGYLVYLKPLLALFSWKTVNILSAVFMAALMVLVVILSFKKKKPEAAAAMFIALFFMKPVLIFVSLTMAVCWGIILISMVWMLLRHEQMELRKGYPIFFMMVGMATSYFDFLTYPVATLGFPLCIFYMLHGAESCKESVKRVAGYSVCWAAGYAGLWSMKWVIADVILHTGTFKDSLWSIIGWTEHTGGRPLVNGAIFTIGLNLQEYKWMGYPVAAVILGTALLCAILYAVRKSSLKHVLSALVPYALIFCIPFAWLVVVQSHSALHARFTFRILGIAVLAAFGAGIAVLRETGHEKQGKLLGLKGS